MEKEPQNNCHFLSEPAARYNRVMTSAWHYLQKLLEFGPRPIGSSANQKTADYICNTFDSLGIEVEQQEYPCTAWEHHSTTLESSGITFKAVANAFSPACHVKAGVVPLGTLAELENTKENGKVLLLYGDLVRAPLSPKSWFLKSERDDRIIDLLENIKPAAVLSPPTETDYVGQLTEDWELDIPAATITSQAALHLIANHEDPVRLNIQAQRIPAKARNIVARTSAEAGKRLVLCAHFDTKFFTPGASDNAGGVAVLLALAGELQRQALPVCLEFVAFNGEEYLPMGDDEYLRLAEEYFNSIAGCINFDGGGTALGSTSITAMSMEETTVSSLQQIAQKYPGVVWVEPWPESNHSTFTMRGVPSIAFGAVGTRGLAHSTEDSLDIMSSDKLTEVVKLTTEIVNQFYSSG
jgi:aminopeptidase YwaD